jgi:hypothetical protein
LVFFGFFWVFLVFGLWEIINWHWFFWFFWVFLVFFGFFWFFGFSPNQTLPQKLKIGIGFFWVFLVFFGIATPPIEMKLLSNFILLHGTPTEMSKIFVGQRLSTRTHESMDLLKEGVVLSELYDYTTYKSVFTSEIRSLSRLWSLKSYKYQFSFSVLLVNSLILQMPLYVYYITVFISYFGGGFGAFMG